MISSLVSSLTVLVFGTLYPAYCSYKAVKSKNVREYVKWMMYWIVFALFTSAETFADIFISWVPFYYEVKVVFVIWLLSPYTQGSSVLYRKFIHPALARRESEIDDMISKAKEQGYSAVLTVGSKAMTSATNLALQAITKGPEMLDQFRRSYSSSDVNQVQITELNDDGSPLHYDNDLALVHQHRRANAIDSEEETDLRVREDAEYLEDRRRRQSGVERREPRVDARKTRVDARRPMHSTRPTNARQTKARTDRDASERKQRLETWEEDHQEAENVTSSSISSSSSFPSSASSPSSISPRQTADARFPRGRDGQERGHRRSEASDDRDGDEHDDDDRYDDYDEDFDNRDRDLVDRSRDAVVLYYEKDGSPVFAPHPPPPRTKTMAEMSLDERLKELESYDPSLSSNLPPASLARINRHYVAGLRQEEVLKKSKKGKSK